MITPLYHLRVLNTPGRRLLSASVVRYKAPKQRPVDKGQGQKPEVTSDSGPKTSEKLHIKKAPGKTSTPQPPKTPDKTSGPEANKKSSDKKSSDKKSSDKKSSDKKSSDKKSSDKKSSDKKSSDKSRETPRPEDTKKNGDTHPLEEFFSQYSKFQYQPTRSPVTEFNRLRKEYGWERELAIARYEFKRAEDAMKELQHTEKNGVTQPLKSFFSRYSKFKYQPASSPNTEFKRLCEEYGWEKELKDACREFDLAMKMEFNSLYGSDEKDIKNWYKLCHVLRIDPAPNTLKECREAVLEKHVNLVDLNHRHLVERFRKNIPIFKWEEDLCVYTNVTGKFFPKEDAADGGVLRALRRHVLTLPDGAVLRALCHYILTSPDGRVVRALRRHILTLPDDGISRALRRHFDTGATGWQTGYFRYRTMKG